MFIIGNFFLILNLVLLIILIHFFCQAPYKKNFFYSCLNYFLVNSVHVFAIHTMHAFRSNIALTADYILVLSGLFYLYYQYYFFQNIVFFITKERVQNENKIVFFTIAVIISIRFFLKLNNFFNNDNLASATLTTFLTAKILFLAMLLIYTVFILLYIVPAIIFLYNYLVSGYRQSIYFKYLRLLCIMFIIKIILEILQSIFLDYSRFFLQNTSLFYIFQKMQHDSDVMITFLSVYVAPVLHIQFLLFLYQHRKVIKREQNYTLLLNNRNQEFDKNVPFSLNELKNIFIKDNTISELIELYIFKEVSMIVNCDVEDCLIIDNNNISNNSDFHFQNINFLSYLKTNQVLSYDYLCDFCHAAEMIEINNTKLFEYQSLLGYCIEKKIKLAINLSGNNIDEVNKIMIIKLNEKTEFMNLNEKKISKIIQVVKVWFSIETYHFLFNIRKKFDYLNCIEQANLIEQKKMYEMKYRKIKNNFLESKLIPYFVPKGRVKMSSQIDIVHDKCIKEVHGKIYETQKYSQNPFLSCYVYKNKEYVLASFYPTDIEKNKHSIHLILSGMKLLDNTIIPIFDEDNVELLFQMNNTQIKNSLIAFYSQLQYTYNIKIIIMDKFDHIIVKKILNFAILGYELERINLKEDIFSSDEAMVKLLEQMFDNKNKIFLLYDICSLSLERQNYFFYEYSLFLVKNKNSNIKIFFILSDGCFLEKLSEEIIAVSVILKSPKYIVSDFSQDDINALLCNFNFYLFENSFDSKEISYYLTNILSYKSNIDIYDFINFFFKFIESKILENLYDDDIQEILYGLQVGKKALKNNILMYKLKRLCGYNNTKLACLLEIDKSTIIRYFAKTKKE